MRCTRYRGNYAEIEWAINLGKELFAILVLFETKHSSIACIDHPMGAGSGTWTRGEPDLAEREGATIFSPHGNCLNGASCHVVDEQGWRFVVETQPSIAPLHERYDDRIQFLALLGEAVPISVCPIFQREAFENAKHRKAFESCGQDVSCDTEFGLEFIKARRALGALSNNQQ